MSDMRVAPASEATRVTRTNADGGRREREPAPRQEQSRREASTERVTGKSLRVRWTVGDDGEMRIQLVDAQGRAVGEVTPEELLARAGGEGTGLLLQASK